jgi:hypothetical protein
VEEEALAHDPEKWEPVFGQDHPQIKCQPVAVGPFTKPW